MFLKKILMFTLVLFSTALFFAESEKTDDNDSNSEEKESNIAFYVTVEAAYDFKAKYETGSAHFSDVEKIYDGLEAKALLSVDYTIPTPLGDNALLKDANVVLKGDLEVAPVTVRPKATIKFTPVPFFILSAGASIGTGWTLNGWEGMSIHNEDRVNFDYEDLTPFKHFLYDYWIGGTLQFDTGFIIPGDWTHFLFVFDYQLIYKGLTGVSNDDFWKWQTTANYSNGLQFYSSLILGYQMPMKLHRVGIFTEVEGHFKNSDYGVLNNNDYNGSFKKITVSPFAWFDFTKNTTLIVIANISSRRAFEEEHSDVNEEPFLNYSGREWFLYRIGFRFIHYFKK